MNEDAPEIAPSERLELRAACMARRAIMMAAPTRSPGRMVY